MTPTQFCQTCSSQAITHDAYIPPCCGVPICAACTARNPRLRDYSPCLRCGDVRSAAGSQAVARGRAEREARRAEAEARRFVLGDSDEDGGEGDEDEDEGEGGGGGGGGGGSDGFSSPPGANDAHGAKDAAGSDLVQVQVTHTLARGDTLLSVARKYAADPHDLLALNDLPHSALYANPSLLRTRRTLVVARRRVPAAQATEGVRPGEDGDGAGRTERRALRRFQRVSREENGVGRVYLALDEDDTACANSSSPRNGHEHGCTGVDVENGGEAARRAEGDADTSGEKKHGPRTADLASRALAHYFDDEEWAAGAAEPARGTSRSGRWRVVAPVLPEGIKEEGSGSSGGGGKG